jgi:hypothetical protein
MLIVCATIGSVLVIGLLASDKDLVSKITNAPSTILEPSTITSSSNTMPQNQLRQSIGQTNIAKDSAQPTPEEVLAREYDMSAQEQISRCLGDYSQENKILCDDVMDLLIKTCRDPQLHVTTCDDPRLKQSLL